MRDTLSDRDGATVNPAPITAYFEESACPSDRPFHIHHEHELILVTGGEARFTVENSDYRLTSGSLLVIGSLERHELTITGFPYRRYVLSISSDFLLHSLQIPELCTLFIHRPTGFCHQIPLTDEALESLIGLFDLLITESAEKQAYWQIRCAGLLTDLLILLYRRCPECFPSNASSPHMALLLSVQRYLQERFREPVTLRQTADAHFISRFHLSRIFLETTGYHFKEYLTLLRLNEAKRLLAAGDLPITAVGNECGYADVNHFIRTFREHEGMPPLQYRRSCCSGPRRKQESAGT